MWENVGVLLKRLDLAALCPLEILKLVAAKEQTLLMTLDLIFSIALVYDF